VVIISRHDGTDRSLHWARRAVGGYLVVADLEPATGSRLPLEERLGEGAWASSSARSRSPRATRSRSSPRAELSADETFRRRFVHEARAAGEVRHKHLVPITDAGEAEGRPYLAVAFVAGQTLEARLASDGRMTLEDMVRVVAHVASGSTPCTPGGSCTAT
jgi:serine/threonine protein kinase